MLVLSPTCNFYFTLASFTRVSPYRKGYLGSEKLKLSYFIYPMLVLSPTCNFYFALASFTRVSPYPKCYVRSEKFKLSYFNRK